VLISSAWVLSVLKTKIDDSSWPADVCAATYLRKEGASPADRFRQRSSSCPDGRAAGGTLTRSCASHDDQDGQPKSRQLLCGASSSLGLPSAIQPNSNSVAAPLSFAHVIVCRATPFRLSPQLGIPGQAARRTTNSCGAVQTGGRWEAAVLRCGAIPPHVLSKGTVLVRLDGV
jgi:hypothetical protein